MEIGLKRVLKKGNTLCGDSRKKGKLFRYDFLKILIYIRCQTNYFKRKKHHFNQKIAK